MKAADSNEMLTPVSSERECTQDASRVGGSGGRRGGVSRSEAGGVAVTLGGGRRGEECQDVGGTDAISKNDANASKVSAGRVCPPTPA
jgi:hypothetical protein